MHQSWAQNQKSDSLKIDLHKQMNGIFCCMSPTKHNKNSELIHQYGAGPNFIHVMTQTVGMIQPLSRLNWSHTSYQTSYTLRTWISLMKADPRSEPGGVRSAPKQEVDEIKRTNQIVVWGD